MEQYSLEGTWEEILGRAPELAGRRVRLTVLASESPKPESAATLDQLLKDRVGRVEFEPADLSMRGFDPPPSPLQGGGVISGKSLLRY